MFGCPICKDYNAKQQSVGGFQQIECIRCGSYKTNLDAVERLPDMIGDDEKKLVVVSFKVAQSSSSVSYPLWTLELFHRASESSLPLLSEQIDLALVWLGRQSSHIGQQVNVRALSVEGFIGAVNYETAQYIFDALEEAGLILFNSVMGGETLGRAKMTVVGWQRYEEITKGQSNSNKVFMAMRFGEPVLNKMFSQHFKTAVAKTGLELFKLDDKPEAGLIDIRMRQEIKSSKFMIADLTHDNLGAYWEAGFAEGLGKKVIYTCEQSKFSAAKTHFDVNHQLTILWDATNPLEAEEQLLAAIRYTFPEVKQQD